MITSTRSQLGKLLIDNPDCVIHNSWDHRNKENASIQMNEFEACMELLKYAQRKRKWFVFISTAGNTDNHYLRMKRKAEEQIKKMFPSQHTIFRLPTLLSRGTVFEKFYTGEYKIPSGKIVEFTLLEDAAAAINNGTSRPLEHIGIIGLPGEMIHHLPDRAIKAMADFYRGLE